MVRAPVLALVVASAIWGVATSATKYALRGFGPLTLLSVELSAATVVLWAVLLLRGYRRPKSLALAAVLGLLEPAVAYLGETLGLARTSASNAALIFGLETAFVVVLAAVFLGERLTASIGVTVLTAFAGLTVLEGVASLTSPRLGDACLLTGALSAAGYTIVARRADEPDWLSLTAHQFAVATTVIVPVATISWATSHESVPAHVPAACWIAATAVGAGGFASTYLLYNWAITSIEAGPAGIIVNLIPAFAVTSAVLWLGDAVTPARVTGGLLIMASVAVFSWMELRAPATAPVGS